MPFDGVVNNTGVANNEQLYSLVKLGIVKESSNLRELRSEDYVVGLRALQKTMRLLKSPDYWVKCALRRRPHGFLSRKQRCMLGAMIDANANCVAYEAVCATIPPFFHHQNGWFPTIAGFNDYPGTDHAEVLATLRNAVTLIEANYAAL